MKQWLGQEKKQEKAGGGQGKQDVWAAVKYAAVIPLAWVADMSGFVVQPPLSSSETGLCELQVVPGQQREEQWQVLVSAALSCSHPAIGSRCRAQYLPLLPLLRELQGAVQPLLSLLCSRLHSSVPSVSPHRTCLQPQFTLLGLRGRRRSRWPSCCIFVASMKYAVQVHSFWGMLALAVKCMEARSLIITNIKMIWPKQVKNKNCPYNRIITISQL